MNEMADLTRLDGSLTTVALASILERASRVDASLIGVTVALPILQAEQLFVAALDEPAILWAGTPGVLEVGLGTLHQFGGANGQAIGAIAQQTQAIRNNYQGFGLGAGAMEPRFYGGICFAPPHHDASTWSDFSDDEFTLSRILYRADESRASLTLFASRAELASEAFRLAYADRLCRLANSEICRAREQPSPALELLRHVENPDGDSWKRQVIDACRLLESRQLEKVVLARELLLTCAAAPSVATILRRLLGRQDGSVCFALRRGSSTFLGATPERLIAKWGPNIRTEAVAGSAATGDEVGTEALLHGKKDRLEHALVVREIVARMAALGAKISVPEAPELRQFGPLVHLRTLLTTRQMDAPHVLTFGHHLHPTPAVGGVPVDKALEFIREHEPFDRGRYASPVGWFDCNGDGELVVALRSGLIRGREVRLYAGAGLVIGSDADAEWSETELKFRSFLDALGLEKDFGSQLPQLR